MTSDSLYARVTRMRADAFTLVEEARGTPSVSGSEASAVAALQAVANQLGAVQCTLGGQAIPAGRAAATTLR